MQKTLSQSRIEVFHHDHFVAFQVHDFTALARPQSGRLVVDIGGECGFVAEGPQRLGWPERVLDTHRVSVGTRRVKGADAEVDDALAPRVRCDKDIACFNLILHHLVGPDESTTLVLQLRAFKAWHDRARAVFVNEYIFDPYLSTLIFRLIYEITISRLLSALASVVSRFVPSLREHLRRRHLPSGP